MRWRTLCAVLIAVFSMGAAPAPNVDELIGGSIWVDLGPGRSVKDVRPAELRELRLCRQPSMMFRVRDGAVTQTFFAGLSLQSSYAKATVTPERTGVLILLFRMPTDQKAAEAVRLTHGNGVLTQWSSRFRPHVYVRCIRR